MNPTLADSNHYALPLPISPVVSTETMKVIRVDLVPTGTDNTIKPTEKYKIKPPNEYIPEAQTLRTDLKPLNVVQPEGASFKVTQKSTLNVVEWQKWSFKVGFNQREGPVLYDVSCSQLASFESKLNITGSLRRAPSFLPFESVRHEYSVCRSSPPVPQEIRIRSR
jgi:Cu2+-containing amine oxidase